MCKVIFMMEEDKRWQLIMRQQTLTWIQVCFHKAGPYAHIQLSVVLRIQNAFGAKAPLESGLETRD